MTDREKAIVMAYTGCVMLNGDKLDIFYEYLAELYGRPVYSHEIPDLEIKEKSKADFLALCENTPPKTKSTSPCNSCRSANCYETGYVCDRYKKWKESINEKGR